MMFIGMDIAKLSFDVAIINNDRYYTRQFNNNLTGFSSLLEWVMSFNKPALFCLEATGIYGLALAKYLYEHQQKVIVANPIQTHAFARMEMTRNKTDKADAQSIARYCAHLHHQGKSDKVLYTPSVNRTRLSKMGCSRLRKSLYMPALVAVRYNPQMMGFYHRLLARGKAKKVALVAVMRKLLVLAYGVLKSGKPFDPNYQN